MKLILILQPLLSKDLHRQPLQAPHHRPQGHSRLGGPVHRRLHVQGRNLSPRIPADRPHKSS